MASCAVATAVAPSAAGLAQAAAPSPRTAVKAQPGGGGFCGRTAHPPRFALRLTSCGLQCHQHHHQKQRQWRPLQQQRQHLQPRTSHACSTHKAVVSPSAISPPYPTRAFSRNPASANFSVNRAVCRNWRALSTVNVQQVGTCMSAGGLSLCRKGVRVHHSLLSQSSSISSSSGTSSSSRLHPSRSGGKTGRSSKRRARPGRVRALGPVEIVAVVSIAAISLAAVILPIAASIAAVAAVTAGISGLLLFVFTPLLPVVLAAFGLMSVSLAVLWGLVDRALCLLVTLNFLAGVVGFLREGSRGSLALSSSDEQGFGEWVGSQGGVWESSWGGAWREGRRWGRKSWSKRERQQWKKRERGWGRRGEGGAGGDREGEVLVLPKPFWLLPSLVSIVPGVHGAAWALALAETPPTPVAGWPFKAGLLRNAFIYGVPGALALVGGTLFGLGVGPTVAAASAATSSSAWLFGVPFFGPLLAPLFGATKVGAAGAAAVAACGVGSFWNCGGSSLWLSLSLGAVHMQLDRLALTRDVEARRRLLEGDKGVSERERVDAAAAVEAAEVEEAERRAKELFDARLNVRTASLERPGEPADWSVADVATWLEEKGLGQYRASFLRHNISGAILLALSAEEIRDELKVDKLGDRKRLLALIAGLRGKD